MRATCQKLKVTYNKTYWSKEELFLSEATAEYGRFIFGEGNISLVAERITNYKPSASYFKIVLGFIDVAGV